MISTAAPPQTLFWGAHSAPTDLSWILGVFYGERREEKGEEVKLGNGSGGSSPQYLGGHGPMASEPTYNWGLGAEPPAGSRGRARGQGGRAPLEAEALLVFGRLM